MSSGHKRMNINTRERVVSTDTNRLEAFAAAERSAFMRRLLENKYVVDISCGYASEQSAITSPLAADVISGLMVQPQLGTSSVTITNGELGCYFPDVTPNPDDDAYKLIDSAGVSAVGVLTIAANAGGGVRIDVIECQPVEMVEEQDSRDIFDPASGLFTPQLVDKVVVMRLQYRVRQGAPGGGYPGNVAGWLPLAVASVPAGGGASTDDVTFWDVRPLIVDRAVQPFNAGSLLGEDRRRLVIANKFITPGQIKVRGSVDLTWGYYRAGGTLAKGTPTVPMGTGDVPSIDPTLADNQEPGFTPTVGSLWYVYAAFPAGLPRWVRYSETDISGLGRVPGSMRGIGMVSMQGPDERGSPLAAIALPASTGLGLTTTAAVMIAAGVVGAGPTLGAFASDGRMCLQETMTVMTPTATTATTEQYELINNVTHPNGARRLRAVFVAQFSGGPGPASFVRLVHLIAPGSTNPADVVLTVQAGWVNCEAPGGAFYDEFEVDIPLLTTWPTGGISNFDVVVEYFNLVGATKSGPPWSLAGVSGWDCGP